MFVAQKKIKEAGNMNETEREEVMQAVRDLLRDRRFMDFLRRCAEELKSAKRRRPEKEEEDRD